MTVRNLYDIIVKMRRERAIMPSNPQGLCPELTNEGVVCIQSPVETAALEIAAARVDISLLDQRKLLNFTHQIISLQRRGRKISSKEASDLEKTPMDEKATAPGTRVALTVIEAVEQVLVTRSNSHQQPPGRGA